MNTPIKLVKTHHFAYNILHVCFENCPSISVCNGCFRRILKQRSPGIFYCGGREENFHEIGCVDWRLIAPSNYHKESLSTKFFSKKFWGIPPSILPLPLFTNSPVSILTWLASRAADVYHYFASPRSGWGGVSIPDATGQQTSTATPAASLPAIPQTSPAAPIRQSHNHSARNQMEYLSFGP